jgi:DedD protein
MESYETVESRVEQNSDEMKQATKDRVKDMRKKSDLSDIILEREHSSQERKKRFLLGVATLILIFLISLIVYNIINTPKESITNKVQTKQISNPPIEPTKQKDKESTPTTKVKKTLDTDARFEEMVRRLKEQDALENTTVVEAPQKIEPYKDSVNLKKNQEIKPINIENKPVTKEIKIQSKPTANKVELPTKIQEKESIQVPSFIEFSNRAASGYYIQVGATVKSGPDTKMKNTIISNGFTYITHPVIVKGRKINKILIGPFNSRSGATTKLKMIRSTINPQSFLYHLR